MAPPGQEKDDRIEEWRDWEDHQYLPDYYTGGRVPGWYRRRWLSGFTAVQLFAASIIALAFLVPLVAGVVGRWPGAIDVGAAISAAVLAGAILWRVRHEMQRRHERRQQHS